MPSFFRQVISGQQLPKPKESGAKGNTVDPYVTVEIFGIPADCVEERTKTVRHNGKFYSLFSKLPASYCFPAHGWAGRCAMFLFIITFLK